MTETQQDVTRADASDAARGYDVFVSYSRADRESVVDLIEGLQIRGLRAWVDLEDIPASAEWMNEIEAAIAGADGYLVVVSPDLARSAVCAQELEQAVASGKRIVPILVRPTDPGSVPWTLAALNWIDATGGSLDSALDAAVEALRPFQGHRDQVNAVTFSPDGNLMASVSDDSSVIVWDTSTGEPLFQPLRGHRGHVIWDVAFSPDGTVLASAGGGGVVRLWDPETGTTLGAPLLAGDELSTSLAFSPDANHLAVSRFDGAATVWDVASREAVGPTLRRPEDQAPIYAVAFSPDEGTIVTAHADGGIQRWDATTHEPVGQALVGHSAAVVSLDFSPDGRTLASGSVDSTIVLRDTETWEQIGGAIPGYGYEIYGLDFSPDGTTLASGGSAGSVYLHPRWLWSSDRDLLRDRLCSVAGRDLTADEWAQYAPFHAPERVCAGAAERT